MDRRPSGEQLICSVDRAFTVTMVVSNAVGATLVFVFLTLIEPVRHAPPLHRVLALNWPLAVGYLVVASIVAPWWGRRQVGPLTWLREDRAPDPAEQREVLRTPLWQVKIIGIVWLIAAIAFAAVNARFSADIAGNVAGGIVMGGLVTATICYLLGERAMRPITARALECGVPLRPVAPGVTARTILAWGLPSGLALLAMGDLAIGMIDGQTPRTAATAWSLVFLAAVGLAAGALAIVVAAKSVAEPIGAVRRALARVEQGEVDVVVEVDDASEVGLLQAGFNRMVHGLRERERLRDLFGRHVGVDVARRALESGVALGGELRYAAVLFVDVVGSTRLAASVPPVEVVERLNRFFGVVLSVVQSHGGWVNKFEGDAALCVFGVPTTIDDPSGRALAAARELSSRLAHDSPLAAAIGVSAGDVVAGNIGAAERFEYTVIGDAVNEAARLSELAKTYAPRLLAAARAVTAAGGHEAALWAVGGGVTLRGRSVATELAVPASADRPASAHASERPRRQAATRGA